MPGRDNGFVARHYLPLADLDPRLAEAMLDVLRAESIAAYVEPSTGHVGGYLDVHLPERPRDRLWVDRERHEQAAALLSQHTAASTQPSAAMPGAAPAGPASDETSGGSADAEPTIEDVWAQLVANYDAPTLDAVPRWPVAEDVPAPKWTPYDMVDGQQTLPLEGLATPDAGEPAVPRRIIRPADRRNASPSAPMTPDDGDLAGYEQAYDPLSILDEHFVPPTPPPPPALRPATKWAILSIVAGFALIIIKTFTDHVPGAIALGVIGIVGGFAVLVAGMRAERTDDSDSDDGAVV